MFEGKNIRRIWHNEQWYFSVVDVINVLTDSPTPRQYWGKVKDRELLHLNCPQFGTVEITHGRWKLRETDCANTESYFV